MFKPTPLLTRLGLLPPSETIGQPVAWDRISYGLTAFLLAAGAGGAHRPMGYSPEVESPKPPRALTYHGLLTCGGKPVPG